ncbi:ZFP36 [Symbiodinium sp. CCMP2592]|nr:ZFP36 [Symbiodinium sp. CCMP2592]
MEEEEANYEDDEPEPENGDNEDEKPQAQPKAAGAAKKRRRGKGKAKAQSPKEQEERKVVADTIGRSILTAKMKKTKMCEFHKEGRCKYGADCAFAHTEPPPETGALRVGVAAGPRLAKNTTLPSIFAGEVRRFRLQVRTWRGGAESVQHLFQDRAVHLVREGQLPKRQGHCKRLILLKVEELRDDPDAKVHWMSEPSRKRKAEAEPAEDLGLGGLYDFLPPPDPEKDKATAAKARKAEQLSTRPKLPPVDRSRVIFLDVDGVLLPAGSVEMIFIDGVMLPVRAAKEADFNRTALSNLRAIVQQTGASIVLSSEWRRKEEMRDNIRRTLQTQDIPGIQDATPIFQPSAELVKQRLDQAIIWAERRAREIGSWLKQHKDVKAWVAIDDIDFSWADSVKVSGTPLMKHRSVLTNPKYCITEKDAEEAVRILLNPPVIAPGEEADAIAAARYLTEEALAKCAGAGLM